ncbi:N-acetyltransferase [Sporosarcina sp. BI001-red]|uniref:GNAT family N-acetyltransferase n=1 Tax=Sporosarcina sp. BI001-red TaxID=2282866 RepID=UPI000E22B2C1|nr:GNAT family N-acetyltransferase [Sporosarcina sp. BI001-red]REB07318.1 N-acetyltransferase [Sporosarcina sp. BI001-red]
MNNKKSIMHPIKIRNIHEDDYETVLKWSKDDTFCEANGWEKNRTENEIYRWWLHCVNHEFEDSIRRGILLGDQLVGYVDLAHIQNNEAEIGIAIGERNVWGRGIGTESILCMMKYASEKFGITIFNAETHEGNIRSRKMLEKIGFIEIGRLGNEEYLGVDDQLIQYRFH